MRIRRGGHPFLSACFLIFLAMDLILLPNCNPVLPPDHGPGVLPRGGYEHRLTFHLHYRGKTRKDVPYMFDWDYAFHRGMGGGLELGAKAIMGTILFLPNGLQGEATYRFAGDRSREAALQLAMGWHLLDWNAYLNDENVDAGFWSCMPSLLAGSDRYYLGASFPLIWTSDSFAPYFGGVVGARLGGVPDVEAMILAAPGSYRIIGGLSGGFGP